MKLLARAALLLLAALGALLAGCSMESAKDSSIPWNRPADWEGQIPGMGMGGPGGP
jgi:nitrous oxide reductase accessory protein NosL